MNGLVSALLLLASASAYSFVPIPMRITVSPLQTTVSPFKKMYRNTRSMISTGDDRSERYSLDISKTVYTSTVKVPKDAYIAFAEKGMSNAKMHWHKILHQSIMGGAYVGFGGLLALSVAGNLGGVGAANPGIVKMAFAALFPVNLLLVVMTGGQLFTGNTATVAAAKFEKMVEWRELWKSWSVSLVGNAIGCGVFALAAYYTGLLTGGTANLAAATALNKCRATFMQTVVKAILCNWMVSIAVFLAGASNDLTGKLVGCWFPISTFVAIGLEHSIANMFLMPAAMLLSVPLTMGDVIWRNIVPVVFGNAIAGAIVVAASYSYQFGKLGEKSREKFKKQLRAYENRKRAERGEAPIPAGVVASKY